MLRDARTSHSLCLYFHVHVRPVAMQDNMKYLKLQSGGRMPLVGLGTFLVSGSDTERSLNKALELGYRLIDTATGYKNECAIGKVLSEWISSGKVTRDELFISTKLPVYGNRPNDVSKFIKQSLKNLQVEYLDLYLIHLPFSVTRSDENQTDYREMEMDYTTNHVEIWKEMEKQVDEGLTKTIGLSNFNVKQIQRILDNCRIKPENLQIELHLYLQQPEVLKFCKDNEIIVTAYSPLGTKGFRELSGIFWNCKHLPEMLENDILTNVAKKHGKTPAQVLLRFLVQKDVVVIPKTTNLQRLEENYQIFDFELDLNDTNALNSQDAGEGGRIVRFLFFKRVTSHSEYPFPIQQ